MQDVKLFGKGGWGLEEKERIIQQWQNTYSC